MSVNKVVIEILREISGLDSIVMDNSLNGDLALDSLGMVTLLFLIEEKFLIELKESDMNPMELKTVSDVVNLVERYMTDEKES